MHHRIILKIQADSEEDAEQIAKDVLEESIQPESNKCGWDYVSDNVVQLRKADLATYNAKTFVELEANASDYRMLALQRSGESLKRELKLIMAPRYLTKADVPLQLSDDDPEEFKKELEKVAKRKTDRKIQRESFEDLLNIVTNIITIAAQEDRMATYYIEHITGLQKCIDNPTRLEHTLQSTDNHFAIVPTTVSDGSETFYIIGDRHI